MLRVLRQLLAGVLGAVAACTFVVHTGLFVSTFCPPHVPIAEGSPLGVVMGVPILLGLLMVILGYGCRVTTSPRRDRDAAHEPLSKAWRVVGGVAFGFVMVNMTVFFAQTKGISHNRGPEPGRWAWYRDGKAIRALTPEEHEWHNRLEIRFFTGTGFVVSLWAALVFFGQLPFDEDRRRAGAATGEAVGGYPEPGPMGGADEVAGGEPVLTPLGRVADAAEWLGLPAAGVAFVYFMFCPGLAIVCVVVIAWSMWWEVVWEKPRLIRQFRYAEGVLEYRTNLHGPGALPLSEVAGVYLRKGGRGGPLGWSIRRSDGEWLLLGPTAVNGQELIDRLCRDGGWGEPPESPV